MKITCTKTNLLNSVNISLRAVNQKTTMPILECIVIKATDADIKFNTYDMELGIETIVEGIVIQPGSVAINAKIFSDIIRKLPDSSVVIETDMNYMTTITCEKSKFSIAGRSDDEFPGLPTVERNIPLVISQFSLKELVRQTVFSIADNDTNKIMTGELFEIKENYLRVVSLDGHRISIRRIGLKDEYSDTKVIVPGKTLSEISKILSGEISDEIRIFFTDKHILFEFDNTVFLSRLIEGEYYRIDQMLSTDYETKVTINKREFSDCIDRSTLLIKESEKKPIIVSINDSTMDLQVNSTIGSMDEEVAVSKEGKDIMIGFNPKFLMDALRVIDDEDITLYMTNPKAPCFIKNADESYIYLILPVNFNSTVR